MPLVVSSIWEHLPLLIPGSFVANCLLHRHIKKLSTRSSRKAASGLMLPLWPARLSYYNMLIYEEKSTHKVYSNWPTSSFNNRNLEIAPHQQILLCRE